MNHTGDLEKATVNFDGKAQQPHGQYANGNSLLISRDIHTDQWNRPFCVPFADIMHMRPQPQTHLPSHMHLFVQVHDHAHACLVLRQPLSTTHHG